MQCIGATQCGTYLVYSPRGANEIARKSRRFCYSLKNGRQREIDYVAKHVANHSQVTGVLEVLGTDVTLVPMPRSSPLHSHSLWPAYLLAEALVTYGMGHHVVPLLERTKAVRKSSTAPPGQRPTADDHLASFRAKNSRLVRDRQIVIVDDVITRGATMLAAVTMVSEAIPDTSVLGFAFIRTMSDTSISGLFDPVLCEIKYVHGRTQRTP